MLDSKHSFHLQQTKIKIRICILCSFRVLPIVYLICIQIKTFVHKPLYRYISYNCFFTIVLFNTSSIPLLHWIICIRIDRSNKFRSFDFWSCIIWLHSCCINFYFQWVILVPDNILHYSPFYCYYWIWLNKTTVNTNWSLKVPNQIILLIRYCALFYCKSTIISHIIIMSWKGIDSNNHNWQIVWCVWVIVFQKS